jgi:hypothetical protein
VRCPDCRIETACAHSRHERTVAGIPVDDRQVRRCASTTFERTVDL